MLLGGMTTTFLEWASGWVGWAVELDLHGVSVVRLFSIVEPRVDDVELLEGVVADAYARGYDPVQFTFLQVSGPPTLRAR